jgi:hypothetical protein
MKRGIGLLVLKTHTELVNIIRFQEIKPLKVLGNQPKVPIQVLCSAGHDGNVNVYNITRFMNQRDPESRVIENDIPYMSLKA